MMAGSNDNFLFLIALWVMTAFSEGTEYITHSTLFLACNMVQNPTHLGELCEVSMIRASV